MNEKVLIFDGLRGKRIAVLGIGIFNRPLIRMLLARGLTVLACDKNSRDKLDEEVLELEKLGATLHVETVLRRCTGQYRLPHAGHAPRTFRRSGSCARQVRW